MGSTAGPQNQLNTFNLQTERQQSLPEQTELLNLNVSMDSRKPDSQIQQRSSLIRAQPPFIEVKDSPTEQANVVQIIQDRQNEIQV